MEESFVGDLVQLFKADEMLAKGQEYEKLFEESHHIEDARQAMNCYLFANSGENPLAREKFLNMEMIIQHCEEIQTARNHFENGDELSAEEMYTIGKDFIDGTLNMKNSKNGMLWIWDSALHGHLESQYLIGKYYIRLKNPELKKEGVQFLRLSAEKGHAEAQFELGNAYANGNGVDVDYQEAKKWYQLAMENGCSMARIKLRRMIEH
ncbi:MAG TPA: hypothetical protein DCO72_07995 [Ruminococcus sp.]|nr:hypothetical protein [Ruminococcus sp.]